MRGHFLRTVNASTGGGGGVLIARPTSVGGWDGGAYTDINEVTPDDSDYVYTWDQTGTNEEQAVTIGFGSLSIASSGDCVLRLREAQMTNGSIETSPNPGRRVLIRELSLGGYTLSPASFYMSVDSTWLTRTWTFDASNISSGSITFSATINNNSNKGGGVSWAEFEYPSA